MGFFEKDRSKIKCQQDPQTGDVICQSSRVMKDGSEEVLASLEATFDNNCNAIPSRVEGQGDELDRLWNKARPLLSQKCVNRPSNY